MHRQVAAAGVGCLGQRVDGIQMLRRHQRASAYQGGQQALSAHRLEQVVQRVDFERVDRELIERRHEDHQRHRLGIVAVALAGPRGNVPGQLDAGHARHLDVHQDDLGPLRLDLRKRLGRIGGLAHDAMRKLRREVGEHLSESGPRGRLVVNDQD